MDVICEDGPAREVGLQGASRLPLLLRMVFDREKGKWDALDALEDTPEAAEVIHVYRLRGIGHVRRDRRQGGSARVGFYRHVADAGDTERFRDTGAWREWAEAYPLPEQP